MCQNGKLAVSASDDADSVEYAAETFAGKGLSYQQPEHVGGAGIKFNQSPRGQRDETGVGISGSSDDEQWRRGDNLGRVESN